MQSSIVVKLISLLTVLSETRKPLTFSDIVEKSGLNKSTIHRLLAIAMEQGLVQHDKQRRIYLIGPKVFDLVRNAYGGYDIQAIALDEMMRLHALVEVNVTIGIPSGMDVVYLRILEANQPMGAMQRPGMRDPMHCSASGKVLLAFLPDNMIDAKLDGYVFKKFTDRTITNADDFRKALKTTRKLGIGTNDREEYDHLLGISAPIFNYMSEPIAVLNLWSSHTLHSLRDLKTWADELKASADRVTALIGGAAPSTEMLKAP